MILMILLLSDAAMIFNADIRYQYLRSIPTPTPSHAPLLPPSPNIPHRNKSLKQTPSTNLHRPSTSLPTSLTHNLHLFHPPLIKQSSQRRSLCPLSIIRAERRIRRAENETDNRYFLRCNHGGITSRRVLLK